MNAGSRFSNRGGVTLVCRVSPPAFERVAAARRPSLLTRPKLLRRRKPLRLVNRDRGAKQGCLVGGGANLRGARDTTGRERGDACVNKNPGREAGASWTIPDDASYGPSSPVLTRRGKPQDAGRQAVESAG